MATATTVGVATYGVLTTEQRLLNVGQTKIRLD